MERGVVKMLKGHLQGIEEDSKILSKKLDLGCLPEKHDHRGWQLYRLAVADSCNDLMDTIGAEINSGQWVQARNHTHLMLHLIKILIQK